MERRDFFKAVGIGAASTALLSVPLSSAIASTSTAPSKTNKNIPLDGIAMAELVREGKATPKELAQEAIAKIKQTNGTINAVVTDTFEQALKRAATINPNAPFAGVPFLVKDCVDYANTRSTNSSRLTQNRIPEKSAGVIVACENAGFNVIGMSHSPEFTTSPSTESELFGVTKNPWDLTLSPGGSTGGGAAAIAAGYVPICHATDGGGSARMPASACGLFGYKPSRELLISGSTDGSDDFLLTHQTFISRSVRDTALASSLVEKHNYTGAYPRTSLGYVSNALTRKLKIGLTLENFFGTQPDEDTRNAIMSTAALLMELGHEVIVVANPVNGKEFYNNYFSIFGQRLAAMGKSVEKNTGMKLEDSKLIGWHTVGMIRDYERRAKQSPDYTKNGYQFMDKLIHQHNELFFKKIDVWLTPVTATRTPKSSVFDPNQQSDYAAMLAKSEGFMSYTPVENVAGNPAISVPLHWTPEGIPVGSHLSTKRGNDRVLFELAFQLESARPWAHRKAPNFV